MCFSAQASFIAAATLTGIGVASLYQARSKRIQFFAAAPLIFGIQQALEGVVWLTLNSQDTTSTLHKLAVSGFIFFAGCFWPTAVPYSLYKLEQQPARRAMLKFLVGIGAGFSAIIALLWMYYGIQTTVIHHHITYAFANAASIPYLHFLSILGLSIYLATTAGALFVSSVSWMWFLGLLVLASFAGAHIWYAQSFGSVWCFFAAAISVCVYGIVIKYQRKYPLQ